MEPNSKIISISVMCLYLFHDSFGGGTRDPYLTILFLFYTCTDTNCSLVGILLIKSFRLHFKHIKLVKGFFFTPFSFSLPVKWISKDFQMQPVTCCGASLRVSSSVHLKVFVLLLKTDMLVLRVTTGKIYS